MNVDDENLQGQCPTPEEIGAYVDGRLSSKGNALIESHLAKCDRCRRIIELVIESEVEVPATTLPDSRK
jgi:anti-sigma factor RsiW